MTNEAVIIELGVNQGKVIRRTIENTEAWEKGTLMFLNGDNVCSGSWAGSGSVVFAGILTEEKVASDGATDVGCYTEGVFDLKVGTVAIDLGAQVVISGANMIRAAAAADILKGAIVGTCEETADAAEVVRVRLKGY